MQYLLLIVEHPERRRDRPAEQRRREYERMGQFGEELKGRGVFRASESLKSVAEGVRISVRGGKRIVADGPFAEAKEMVGGFFLLDCASKAQAMAIASECPAVEWGTVELREVGPCYDD
jgi:hypothetical protein